MSVNRKFQRFTKGLNQDVSESLQPADSYRDAMNMDMVAQGDEAILNQVKSVAQALASNGTTSIIQNMTPTNSNGLAYNILGYCSGLDSNDKECIVIFVRGNNATITWSRILVYHLHNQLLTEVGAAGDATLEVVNMPRTSLTFPESGNVDSFITKDRGKSFCYFVDGLNIMRRFLVDPAVYISYTSVEQLALPRFFPSQAVADITINTNGSLISGTYQFAFRYKNTTLGSFSKWSLLSNPIPVIPETTPLIGGSVGEITNKSIDISFVVSAGDADNYNQVEVAAVKNNTGDRVNQDVAFVSTHTIDAAGAKTIEYNGRLSEYELPITEVVVDDAAIETARTIIETNGRLLAGDVSYFDRRLAVGEGALLNGRVIKESINYATEDNTKSKKGYFRDEVYRFGIVYHDIYGNWSPVKPLDFSPFRREQIDGVVSYTITSLVDRVVTGTSYSDNRALVNVSTTTPSGVTQGDVVRINFGTVAVPDYRYYEVIDTTTNQIQVAAYEAFPTLSLTDTTIHRCLGNDYSHSASNDFKFPDRSKLGYSVLDSDDIPNAIGLELTISGASHPSWATGFAIVRMERDKNILYQSPIVPAVSRLGCVTAGKNTINNRDYNEQFDHLTPKMMQLGVARGFNKGSVIPNKALDSSPPLAYEYIEWFNTNNVSLLNSIRWDLFFMPALDFVANNNGEALVSVPDVSELNVVIKDMAAFMRVSQGVNIAGAKVYQAETKEQYFHDGTVSNYKVGVSSNTSYEQVFFPRIQDTIAVRDGNDGSQFLNVTDFKTEQIVPIVNANEPIVLADQARSNFGNPIPRILAGNALVQQQGATLSIGTAAERAFFEGEVVAQRGLALKANQQLFDPLANIAKRYNDGTKPIEVPWANFIAAPPDSGIKPNARLYNNADMTTTLRGGVTATAVLNDRVQDANVATQLANALYIANLEFGKSDFRYGADNSANPYIFTGAYHKIVNTDNVTIDVWGGDCFITKQTYRVNDNTVIPRVYSPLGGVDGVTWNTTASNNFVSKAGVSNQQPEFIEVFVEAECNANYMADRNIYPFANDSITDYTTPALYNYNFGYSKDNTSKVFFSEDESVEFLKRFPARTIFSDSRILGVNVDAYSRFRALNFFDLEEKYGKITKLTLLNDSETIAVQDQAIRYLLVGKKEIQDDNGVTLTIQSGEFISNIIRYYTTQYGAQNLRCVVPTEFGVFVLDSRNGSLLNIAGEVKVLPLNRMEKFFNDKFSNKVTFADPDLSISYDKIAKQLHVIGRNSADAFTWVTYNAKYDAFISQLDYEQSFGTKRNTMPAFLTTVGGKTFLLNSEFLPAVAGVDVIYLRVGEWRGGSTWNTLVQGGVPVVSSLSYIFNEFVDDFKTIDIVGANGVLPFTSYSVTAHNEAGVTETTGTITGNTQARNGQTYAPLIRDNVSGGRLRGVFARVVMNFSQTNAAIKLYSVFTQFRQSFRP